MHYRMIPMLFLGACAIVLGVALLYRLLQPPVPAAPPAKLAPQPVPAVLQSPWNTYHGDSALKGVGPALEAAALSVRWRYLAGAPVEHTPVAEGGRVFVVTRKGEIVALDQDGKKVWAKTFYEASKTPLPKPREEAFDAPLAVFKGTLLAAASSGALYAIDAATGNERWRANIDGSFLGTPNYRERAPECFVAICQSDASLHGFDPKTGAERWASESIDRCDGAPGVGSDFAVYGSCAAALHVVDTASGKLLRSVNIEGDSQVAGGVAVDGDFAYSGCRSGHLLQVNVRTGQVVWNSKAVDGEIFTTPALDTQWVVAAGEKGEVFGVERATGAKRWTTKLEGKPQSPVIAGDKVLVSAGGKLHVLRLIDGSMAWSAEAGDEISGPACAYGLILVAGNDGAVTAFGAAPQP